MIGKHGLSITAVMRAGRQRCGKRLTGSDLRAAALTLRHLRCDGLADSALGETRIVDSN